MAWTTAPYTLSIATLALALAACDSDERPTCDALGELCHDSTTEVGIDCHETAEDAATTEDACLEMEEACRAECE
jgi:hypothetical protein